MKGNKSIVFFGTPRFAVFVLEELEHAGIIPDLIVTAPDRPKGRGLKLASPPVKDWALAHDIECYQPDSLREASPLGNSEFDLGIVAAYGKILPKALVDAPRFGTLNVHPSLLPKFRGASPVESQILADERTVGVSIMQLDEEMDHGPILAQASITLDEWPVRARDLEELLAREGGALLAESLDPYMDLSLKPVMQDHAVATYTKKIRKEDGEIDLSGDGYQNYLKFCAYDEWPGTFFFDNGTRIKIVDATWDGSAFIPLRVIPEGKSERDYLPK